MMAKYKQHREVDRHIAVNVMGWKKKNLLWVDAHGRYHLSIPKYSTDPRQTLKVIEKLRYSGMWCCLTFSSDYCYTWTIKTALASRHANPEHLFAVQYDGGHEFSLAICLAALRMYNVNFRHLVSAKAYRQLGKENEEIRTNKGIQ